MSTPVEQVAVVPWRAGQTGRGRRVLLLHGMASSPTVWNEFLPLCPDDIEVWSAHLPWRVDGTTEWSLRSDPVRWVAEAFDKVPGGVDLVVAHSFSSVLLLDLLTRHADAGIDPADAYGLRGAMFVSPFFRRNSDEFQWERMGTLLDNFESAMRDGIRAKTERSIEDGVLAAMARVVCERVGPYGWLRFLDSYLRTPWMRTELLTLPCRVLAGARDTTALPNEADRLAEALPNARASRLAGCGHFPMLERPAAFFAEVRGFLDTIALPAGIAESTTES